MLARNIFNIYFFKNILFPVASNVMLKCVCRLPDFTRGKRMLKPDRSFCVVYWCCWILMFSSASYIIFNFFDNLTFTIVMEGEF